MSVRSVRARNVSYDLSINISAFTFFWLYRCSVPIFYFDALDTELAVIEETFRALTERTDIGILLINQTVSSFIGLCCFLIFFFFLIVYRYTIVLVFSSSHFLITSHFILFVSTSSSTFPTRFSSLPFLLSWLFVSIFLYYILFFMNIILCFRLQMISGH